MIQTAELTNIDKIILGYKTEELLKNKVDVFTILDILHIDYNDMDNPNYIILLDVLYKNFFGRQIFWEEEKFINEIIQELIGRKYIALFCDYKEAINDIKFSRPDFNQEWWNEFEIKMNFNFNSI